MNQRHALVLGRSVDLNSLIAQVPSPLLPRSYSNFTLLIACLIQTINSLLRASLDHAIALFEAEDITTVIALEDMILITQETHALLAQHLELDPFAQMVAGIAVVRNRVCL